MESQTWCLWIEDRADNAFPAIRRKPLSCCLCDYRWQRFESGPKSRWRQWSQYKGLCLPSKFHLTSTVWTPQNTLQGPLLGLLPSSHPQTTHTHILHATLDSLIFSFCCSFRPYSSHRAWPTWDFICSSVFPNIPPAFKYWFTSQHPMWTCIFNFSPSHWWTLFSSSITFSTEPSLVYKT